MGLGQYPDRVMKVKTYPNGVVWKLDCYCSDDECMWHFDIEWSREYNEVSMRIYANAEASDLFYQYKKGWLADKLHDWRSRIKTAWYALVRGRVQVGADIGFSSRAHIKAIADAILMTLVHVDSARVMGEPLPEEREKELED